MNTTGGACIMGSFPYPRNGIVKLDFEYILLFKKHGKAFTPTQEQKATAKMTIEEWNTYFAGHWKFSGVRQDKHLAMFPEELPRRLIKMFSFTEETILDPFAGSGTTLKVAKELNRSSVGYEINNEFIPLIKERVDGIEVVIENNLPTPEKLNTDRLSLPYQFVDCHKLDKKVDMKKLQYGSKIAMNKKIVNEY